MPSDLEIEDLKIEFEKNVRKNCAECPSFGYTPTIFIDMVNRYGAVEAVRSLFKGSEPAYGFNRLKDEDKLELTMEALVINNPCYHKLFSEKELDVARWWLDEAERELEMRRKKD